MTAVGLAVPNLGSDRQQSLSRHTLSGIGHFVPQQNSPVSGYVVVGVTAGQSDAVVTAAATFARRFDAELVCAYVDVSRFAVEQRADGTVRSLPFDADAAEPSDEGISPSLGARLSRILDSQHIKWSTRELAGDPAYALAGLAEVLNAAMIVVGSREPGIRASVQEFFSGSVAVHLAHRQHRPVVVVPLSPVDPDASLPWEAG